MVEEPLVSVVTPFHNTADYLEECIRSVLGQEYRRWEYVLLDNCSTDGSAEIAERYACHDSRVRFVRADEFGSQIDHYNRALRLISPDSRYCKLVQADDWIFPECLSRMVRAASGSANVGLVSSFSLSGDFVQHGGLPLGQGPVYDGRAAGRAYLLAASLWGSPTVVSASRSSGTTTSRSPRRC